MDRWIKEVKNLSYQRKNQNSFPRCIYVSVSYHETFRKERGILEKQRAVVEKLWHSPSSHLSNSFFFPMNVSCVTVRCLPIFFCFSTLNSVWFCWPIRGKILRTWVDPLSGHRIKNKSLNGHEGWWFVAYDSKSIIHSILTKQKKVTMNIRKVLYLWFFFLLMII